MQPREIMLFTTESTAWAVAFTAGLTAGVIFGFGITPTALVRVSAVAVIAAFACMKLLRSVRDERVGRGRLGADGM